MSKSNSNENGTDSDAPDDAREPCEVCGERESEFTVSSDSEAGKELGVPPGIAWEVCGACHPSPLVGPESGVEELDDAPIISHGEAESDGESGGESDAEEDGETEPPETYPDGTHSPSAETETIRETAEETGYMVVRIDGDRITRVEVRSGETVSLELPAADESEGSDG